jgi:hypothetical protein
MSLAPSERKALTAIEASLRTTDPKLAARMETFTALASRSKTPHWKCLSPWAAADQALPHSGAARSGAPPGHRLRRDRSARRCLHVTE